MINKKQHGNFVDNRWLTLEQVANYLQMSRSSIYKLVQTRKIPGYKVGRQWRFSREEIDAWVKGQSR